MNTGPSKKHLFDTAVRVLEEQKWVVKKIARAGKSSIRQISNSQETRKVSIKTSRDTWVAFARDTRDSRWETLQDVNYVVVSSVDERYSPRYINIHMIPASDLLQRFDNTLKARIEAGYRIDRQRGLWISLYDKDSRTPPTLVGAGVGLKYPPIAQIPLALKGHISEEATLDEEEDEEGETEDESDIGPLTIDQAKKGLALFFGVETTQITISITS